MHRARLGDARVDARVVQLPGDRDAVLRKTGIGPITLDPWNGVFQGMNGFYAFEKSFKTIVIQSSIK